MKQQAYLLIMMIALGALFALAGFGCSDNPGEFELDGDMDPKDPGEEFTSAMGGGNDSRGGWNAPEASGDGDMASDGDQNDKGDASREIVESDLFKVEGDFIYTLNTYRGLAAIDFSNPSDMTIKGRLALEGTPKEMYVDNDVAVILLSDILYEEDGKIRYGGKVVSVDVSDPKNLVLMNEFPMNGAISDSRQVGDIIYVVASSQPWYDYCSPPGKERYTVEIISISIADPSDVKQVDGLAFAGGGWSVYVTNKALYVAASGYEGYDWGGENPASEITYVDISDPSGLLKKRATFTAAAIVKDRFKMHQNGDVFAVTSITNDWNGDTLFETFDVSDPDDITRKAIITIMEEEELHASRYDGDRAYIVTFRNTDPLFVVDFTDADNPVVLGDLVIPGWSTHLEIRGDKIYGVGVDNEDGWKTKVAIFDVSDPTEPKELDALSLGEGYTESEALYDWKAFKVYDDLGLILVPTGGYDSDWRSYVNQLNLIDFDENRLTRRGSIKSDTTIKRGFKAGDYLGALSETKLMLADYSDRDNPEILSSARLASCVYSLSRCGDALCNTGDGVYNSTIRLQILAKDADADESLYESKPLMQGDGSAGIFSSDKKSYIVTRSYYYWGMDMERGYGGSDGQSGNMVHAFDMSDSSAPKLLGSDSYDLGDREIYSDNQIALVGDSALAVGAYTYDSDYMMKFSLSFFDLSNPKEIKETLKENILPLLPYEAGPIVRDDTLWAPTCETIESDGKTPLGKCYAVAYDASNPAQVKQTAKINVPGQVVGANDAGDRLVSMDMQFKSNPDDDDYLSCKMSLNILIHNNIGARLLKSIDAFENEYCYYMDSNSGYGESEPGREPAVDPVDPDDVEEIDGDEAQGSERNDVAMKVKAIKDGDLRYHGYFVSSEKLFVMYSEYGSYGYADGDVAVESMDGGGCYYGDSDYETRMQVKIFSLKDGELLDTLDLKNVENFTPVEGGGVLLYGYSWRNYASASTAYYLTADGEANQLPAIANGYNYGAQSVLIDDTLYIPAGWSGMIAHKI